MKEKFLNTINKPRSWFLFHAILILALNIIGHIRAENTLHEMYVNLGETCVGFVGTILAFPLGIYFFFADQMRGIFSSLIVLLIPALYYPAFFILVSRITTYKKYWKVVALCLLAFMLFSFAGCSRVVEIPLLVT